VTTLSVLQPGYLPWLGFFDQMQKADVFVLYDDVQFDKHGWRNRNRIKCAHGVQWLTVPVHHRGQPRIDEIEIDSTKPWARKQIATLRQCYAGAAHLEPYVSELAGVLERPWRLLVDLDDAVMRLLAAWLGIETTVVRSSELGVDGERTERLVALCRHFGATRYRSGDAARAYLDIDAFEREGIEVEWQNLAHPVYPQLHGEFVSHLSAIDAILNCGAMSRSLLP
jgi:WbqC-like protein